ncbi:MAG: RNA methyltransferase [Dictyoglomus sp.]|nr:RNA methyltransferase [Dictyoglomus sp.]MCX7941660.1 RNA methyltransferase [Dictyoglomaceae bacterium]MDW8188188.1 RNA methyltransferase [Dictyoglomus sp.]
MEIIQSRRNADIQEILELKDKRQRKEKGKCIVEGWRLLKDAWKSGVYIQKVFISKSFWEKKDKEVEDLLSTIPYAIVEDSLMNKISLLETPPGILGVLPLFLEPRWEVISKEKNSIVIYSDGIQDPGNLGTLIRLSEGLNVSALILSENTVDPYNYKVIRASSGSIFRLPIWISSIKEIIEFFKGFPVIIADPHGEEVYFKYNYKEAFLLILGNEAWGINIEKYRELNPIKLRIPLKKEVESLNVAIAGSAFLFEAQRQRYMEERL